MIKQKLKRYRYCKYKIAVGEAMDADKLLVREVESFFSVLAERDIVLRDILAERYLHGKSWAAVAAAVHSTPDACRMAEKRFFAKKHG